MVTFRGAYAESLGGFHTVRGYAKLSELARCSVADTAYQRELEKKHRDEICSFYQKGEFLFYPEIVLGLELIVDYNRPRATTGDPLQHIIKGNIFKSNVNNVKVRANKQKLATDLRRVNINVDGAQKPFKRIDGNHRLAAYETMADDPANDKLAPFCIILFSSAQVNRDQKAIFYNINSKALTLTSEERYKSIVDDVTGFPDDVLERDFGKAFVICRHILPGLNFNYLLNLKNVFGQNDEGKDSRRSVIINSLNAFELLHPGHDLPSVEELLPIIGELNEIYLDDRLKSSTSEGLFSAFLYFKLGKGYFPIMFSTWVMKNHIYNLNQINAIDLIHIFAQIAQSKHQQIFISMQFSNETNPNYKAITEAIEDINNTYSFNIKWEDIRIDRFHKGYSYSINDEILKLIEESGLLIADLTCGNKNVYHEIGYLMGLNQGHRLPHENFILLHNKSIGKLEDDIGFNISGIKQIRVTDTTTLQEVLKEQIKIFYGLS